MNDAASGPGAMREAMGRVCVDAIAAYVVLRKLVERHGFQVDAPPLEEAERLARGVLEALENPESFTVAPRIPESKIERARMAARILAGKEL